MNDIKLDELNEILSRNSCAFLAGNGFSMNFDKDYGNIFNRLYSAHNDVINNSIYKVKSNNKFTQKCYQNYESVCEKLKDINESDLYQIFEDALILGESIKNNDKLIEELVKENLIFELTFGISQVGILSQICMVGRKKGIEFVNIEHWTILIYFYYAILKIKPKNYELPKSNSFIEIINIGNTSPIKLTNDIFEDVILNGFTTYFRMLFSVAIFSNGKSVDLQLLSNLDNLDLVKLQKFLSKYELLLSLNYDHIMENVSGRKVHHLHGEFVKNKMEYVYNQSFGLKYAQEYVSFSDILIGDYFIFKTFLPVVNNMSKSNINKRIRFSELLNNLIQGHSINTVVLFGMNIENDHHVIRNIMLAFEKIKEKSPKIIYCYFNDREKDAFGDQFEKVITFSSEVNQYVKNIEVKYMRTQEILGDYFIKKEKEILNEV